MKMVPFLIICILGCFSCTSKTNTTDSEKELRQETTIVSEKVYPKYDMSDFNIKELAELLVKEKNKVFLILLENMKISFFKILKKMGKIVFIIVQN